MQRPNTHFSLKAKQGGLALVIVMIFLTAITGITIWAVRQSLMGEGLARNELDQVVARQAAEAALRDAERDLQNLSTTILTNASCARGFEPPLKYKGFTDTCALGLCYVARDIYAKASWSAASGVSAEPFWPSDKGGLWNNNFADTSTLTGKPNRTASTLDITRCTFTGGVPLGTFTGATAITGVAVQPQYLIEVFNRVSLLSKKPAPHYRITARGFGYTQRTQVVLQTIFVPLED